MGKDEKPHWSDLVTRSLLNQLPAEIVLFLDQLEAQVELPEELSGQDSADRLSEWIMNAVAAGQMKLEPYNKLREYLNLQHELPKLHMKGVK
jgi:hypothetical protein